MSKSSSNICQNCNAQIESSLNYCPNCGQKNSDSRITFSELWTEFKDAVLNIESRTWRTFKNLFIPGKLTQEYFSGKRRRYIHPLRLLLVSSLILIIAMGFQDFQSTTNHHYNVREWILKNYERQQLHKTLINIVDSTNLKYPGQQTEIITEAVLQRYEDSINSLIAGYYHRDGYGNYVDINDYADFGSEKSEVVSKYDFLHLTEDELVEKYKKDASSIERLIFKQKLKLIKDESLLAATIVGHTTWAVLLLMPCLALVLYFLNIRHKYFYIEHLIFTFHLHSFSFLIIALLIVGMNIFPWWIFLVFIGIIWMYVLISMWKVYGQPFGKTLFKFIILCFSYGFLFIVFLFGIVISSFFLL